MNKVKEKLKKYFSENDIDKLLEKLESKQRSFLINDNYFVKIGKNSNKFFFDNLIKEIDIYKNNQGNQNLPNLIDYYICDDVCLIILEKINGKMIGQNRNEFNLNLTKNERLNIIKNVLDIKNIKINNNLDNSYNREECLQKYLETSKMFLDENIYNKIRKLKNEIISEKYERVIAHGDLISTNIMLNKDNVIFIDWEFISYKPKYYDLIYFLLFSKTDNSIDIIDEIDFNIDKKESFKDGILLCLKEIKNNSKLYGKIDYKIINKNISRWKRELNNLLEKF
ncbi:MAG: phosphotransferase [Bacilli bacterium]|nr:phosphotransferase [Bacilli bacterium]